MVNKPTPPRRGLPDDAVPDAVENIGARAGYQDAGGRFSTPEPPRPHAPRRGRRMLNEPDDDAASTPSDLGQTHTRYSRTRSTPVPPPPTPVPPFRGGRAGRPPGGATVIAADITTAPASPSADSTDIATEATSKAVWAPGPVTQSADDHGHDADVLHHAPRSPGRRLRIVGLVAGGLVVALIAVFGIRALLHPPTSGPASSSSTTAASPTIAPPFTTDDLPTVEEASKLSAGDWTILDTVETVNEDSPKIACYGTGAAGEAKPTLSRVRALTTATEVPAMVLRLDAYPSTDAAHKVYAARAKMMGSCQDVPAYLYSASTVTGLADEAIQVTVVYQDAKTIYHTLLIARVGNSIVMTDALNQDKALGAQQTVDATQGTLARFCKPAQGACPTTPKAAAAPLPPAAPVGWLAPNDIPRVTAGAGQWSANDPFPPTTKGAFCENVTLTRTEATKAEQRTYLLAQDSAMPQFFGLDELSLTFAAEAEAKAFADKMASNIAGCAKRNPEVAKILESQDGTTTGADGKQVSAKTWKFSLSVGQETFWQVAVVTTGTHTIYLLTNIDANYGFTKDQYLQIALRSGVRATQTS